MIVLKEAQERVLAALQSIAGIVNNRRRMPVLANVLIRGGRDAACGDECAHARLQPVLTIRQPLLQLPGFEPSRPALKVSLRSVQVPRGFFGATKVNARNAP